MTQLSNLYGSANANNTDLYLSTVATTFGIPRENVQLWNDGLTVDATNEVRIFNDAGTGGVPYHAPNATPSNLISMGATPVGDVNWEIYSVGAGTGAKNALFVRHVATLNQTLFAIPPGSSFAAENLDVYVSGVRQAPLVDYLVTGTDIEFTFTIPVNEIVDIYSFYSSEEGDFSFAAPIIANYVGDGIETQFSLIAANLDTNGIFVSLDGVEQSASRDFSYDTVQNLIIFNIAPPDTTYIDIKAFAPYVVGTPLPAPAVVPTISQFIANGAQTDFTIPGAPVADAGAMDVFISGVAQTSLGDFNYANGVLSLNFAPAAGDVVDVKLYSTTVVNQTSSYVTSTGSTAPRTLGNRFSDITNVKDFGAKGDGTTNDENAFIAAGNGPVFIPAASYVIPVGNDYSTNVYFSFGAVTIIGNTTLTIKDLLV